MDLVKIVLRSIKSHEQNNKLNTMPQDYIGIYYSINNSGYIF